MQCLRCFYFISQLNTCVVGTKKTSHRDSSFGHPNHMFKLMDKEIIRILCSKSLLIYDPMGLLSQMLISPFLYCAIFIFVPALEIWYLMHILEVILQLFLAEWIFSLLPTRPVHFCFKGCWLVFFTFIQILVEHSLSKQWRP